MAEHQTQYAIYPSLADRTIVITGGAQGIAAAMVEQFALQGSQVIFLNVNKDILMGYYAVLEQKINKAPFTQVVDEAIEQVAEALARQMDAVGSSGKA